MPVLDRFRLPSSGPDLGSSAGLDPGAVSPAALAVDLELLFVGVATIGVLALLLVVPAVVVVRDLRRSRPDAAFDTDRDSGPAAAADIGPDAPPGGGRARR